MDGPEKDIKVIERGALLQKKRLLDELSKRKKIAPSSQNEFNISCSKLVDVTGVRDLDSLKNLLASFKEVDAFEYSISKYGAVRWGDWAVKILVLDQFSKVHSEVSKKYHEANASLQDESSVENQREEKRTVRWIYYTNPIYIVMKLGGLMKALLIWLWRHRFFITAVSLFIGVLAGIVTLIVADYQKGQENIDSVLQTIRSE